MSYNDEVSFSPSFFCKMLLTCVFHSPIAGRLRLALVYNTIMCILALVPEIRSGSTGLRFRLGIGFLLPLTARIVSFRIIRVDEKTADAIVHGLAMDFSQGFVLFWLQYGQAQKFNLSSTKRICVTYQSSFLVKDPDK